jgi:hypothetical protein
MLNITMEMQAGVIATGGREANVTGGVSAGNIDTHGVLVVFGFKGGFGVPTCITVSGEACGFAANL